MNCTEIQYGELRTLARDEAANEWVDNNVSEFLAEKLRAWSRQMIDQLDSDDQAQIGVMLTEACRPLDTQKGLLPKRGHIYALVFTWADLDGEREQKLVRAVLYVNDANQVIDFALLDGD